MADARGLAFTEEVPESAVLGTFWAWSAKGPRAALHPLAASGIRVFHEESELERKQDALESKRGRYALIRKKGTLSVSNPRAERTPLRIHLSTGGKVEQVSGEGRVNVDDFRLEDWGDRNLAAVNSHSEVEWTLTLEPGERRTLTYEVAFWR